MSTKPSMQVQVIPGKGLGFISMFLLLVLQPVANNIYQHLAHPCIMFSPA